MWKSMVEPDRPQMTVHCMHFACWIPKLQTHTMCCTYFFSMATVVTGTRLNVKFLNILPVLLNLYDIWPAQTILLDYTLYIFAEIHKLWNFHCEVFSPTFNCYCVDTLCLSFRSETNKQHISYTLGLKRPYSISYLIKAQTLFIQVNVYSTWQ